MLKNRSEQQIFDDFYPILRYDSSMIDRPSTRPVFDQFMLSAPQPAPKDGMKDDISLRIRQAAKTHMLFTSFRHNSPDITGQESDNDVRIQYRRKISGTNPAVQN